MANLETSKKEESKSVMVSVRISAEEEATLKKAAGQRGESISKFVRDAALGKCSPLVADLSLFQTTETVVGGNLAFVMDDNQSGLIPKTASGPFFLMH
jgi:uncharacterized protein (DUF1778 family)